MSRRRTADPLLYADLRDAVEEAERAWQDRGYDSPPTIADVADILTDQRGGIVTTRTVRRLLADEWGEAEDVWRKVNPRNVVVSGEGDDDEVRSMPARGLSHVREGLGVGERSRAEWLVVAWPLHEAIAGRRLPLRELAEMHGVPYRSAKRALARFRQAQ